MFAERLRQARELRQLTQRRLGIEMGLDGNAGGTRINRYEHGASDPSLASIEKLAETLNVPAAYLLAESDAMADAILVLASDEALTKLIQSLKDAPPDERAARAAEMLRRRKTSTPAT